MTWFSKKYNSFKDYVRFETLMVFAVVILSGVALVNTVVVDQLVDRSNSSIVSGTQGTYSVANDIPEPLVKSHYLISIKNDKIIPSWIPKDEWGYVGIGTATAIGPHTLLTCYHVINKPDDTEFMLYEFGSDLEIVKRYKVKMVSGTFHDDLALLETKDTLPYFNPVASLDEFDQLKVGSSVLAIGAYRALAPFWAMRTNIIALNFKGARTGDTPYDVKWESSTLISYPIVGGFSGGGLYSEAGKLIGILAFSNSAYGGAVDLRTINEFLAAPHKIIKAPEPPKEKEPNNSQSGPSLEEILQILTHP